MTIDTDKLREEFFREDDLVPQPTMLQLCDELDQARALAEGTQEAFNLMMDERVKVSSTELEQARADVLKLLKVIAEVYGPDDRSLQPELHGWVAKVLADTEHYTR